MKIESNLLYEQYTEQGFFSRKFTMRGEGVILDFQVYFFRKCLQLFIIVVKKTQIIVLILSKHINP